MGLPAGNPPWKEAGLGELRQSHVPDRTALSGAPVLGPLAAGSAAGESVLPLARHVLAQASRKCATVRRDFCLAAEREQCPPN